MIASSVRVHCPGTQVQSQFYLRLAAALRQQAIVRTLCSVVPVLQQIIGEAWHQSCILFSEVWVMYF